MCMCDCRKAQLAALDARTMALVDSLSTMPTNPADSEYINRTTEAIARAWELADEYKAFFGSNPHAEGLPTSRVPLLRVVFDGLNAGAERWAAAQERKTK